MTVLKSIAQVGLLLLGGMLFAQGCVGVVEPREGYWDHDLGSIAYRMTHTAAERIAPRLS